MREYTGTTVIESPDGTMKAFVLKIGFRAYRIAFEDTATGHRPYSHFTTTRRKALRYAKDNV